MSNGVGFDVFDLSEQLEFIDEIALVPNLDLTAGTQIEVVFPDTGETVHFTLASNAPAGQPIVVDVQTGENRSFGEYGVNDAWTRIDTAVASIEQAVLTPGAATGAFNASAMEVSGDAAAEIAVAASDAGLQVVFVDANADNVQQLIDGIDPSYEVHIIDTDQDGVAFMASILEGRSGIDAVHILSHGQSGQLQLGNAMVDAASIAGSQAQSWDQIGGSLADAGDILIYGCDFGEGRLGSLTVEALSQATGADVSASDDDTGSAGLGGNWDLEVTAGTVEAETIAVEEFNGLLELVQSEVIVPATNQADTLAQNIFGAGVTINSASYTGAASQAATFSGALDGAGSAFLGFDSGVIFSTGNANGIVGTTAAGNFGTDITDPGATDDDPDFNSLENGISTFDASFLEANITSTTGVLTLQFVFGSDEYNEYVYAGFNDSIGIWINGVNYAVTTDGQQVGIDTINSAGTINPTSTQSADSKDPNSTHDPTDGIYESANQSLHATRTTEPTQMDGYTTTISVNINLQIGVATDIKIGIADTGDAIYDSWLIVRENSFESVLAAFEDEVVTTPNTSVVISPLDNDFSDTYTAADLTITKINGVDVVVGQTVTLPSGVMVTLNADKTLTVDPDGNAISHDTFTYEITDPLNQTAVGLVGMNTNGAPLLNLDPDNSGGGFDNRGYDAYFNTNTGDAVNIADADIDITDLNSPNLTAMSINVSGVADGNNELLNIGGTNFALATGVTGTLVAAGGVNFLVDYDVSGTPDAFSITVQGGGTAPQAAWEALIASITYDNTSGTATFGNREFDIIINDGTNNSNVGEAIVHVATPDAVIGGTDTGSVLEDSSPFTLTTGGTLSITDPDNGEALFVEGTYGGTYGDVSLNPLGGWTYSASNTNPAIDALAAGESLVDTITVTSVDGTSHDIVITIDGANDDPTFTVGGALSVQENVADGGTIGSAFDPAGTVVGVLTPVDVDTSDTHTFTIVNALGNPVTDPNFEIVGDEIRVKTGNTLDFETATSHEIHILVDDGNGGTFIQTVNIDVTDFEGMVTDGAGDNTYVGTSEEDTFVGADGLNYFIGGEGADTIDATVGHCDYASYITATTGVTVDLNLATQAANSGDATGDVLIGVENLFGSTFDDVLTGDDGFNYLRGDDGDDTLIGSGGNDHLEGGLGADVLNGGDGQDFVRYHRATSGVTVDLVNGGSGGEALGDTYIDVEFVQGSAFDDVLIGTDQRNSLVGGDGNDRLVGGGGVDTLYGQGGDDTYVFSLAHSAGGRIYLFTSGSDTLEFAASELGGSISAGALNASDLTFGASAVGANAQFVYNTTSGMLSFDADGDGAGAAQAIVTLTGAPTLAVGDFDIV